MLCADAHSLSPHEKQPILSLNYSIHGSLYNRKIDGASISHLIAHFISHSFSLGMCTIIYLFFFLFSFLPLRPPSNGLISIENDYISVFLSFSFSFSCVHLCLCAWMNEMNAQSKPCECSHLLNGSFFFYFYLLLLLLLLALNNCEMKSSTKNDNLLHWYQFISFYNHVWRRERIQVGNLFLLLDCVINSSLIFTRIQRVRHLLTLCWRRFYFNSSIVYCRMYSLIYSTISLLHSTLSPSFDSLLVLRSTTPLYSCFLFFLLLSCLSWLEQPCQECENVERTIEEEKKVELESKLR